MKQISTLFDALRNEKFAIAVKDDYGIKYYGYPGQGKEWAQWANTVETKSLEQSQLPAGIIQGPFKKVDDEEIKSLIVSFGYAENSIMSFTQSKNYKHSSSVKIKSFSRVPAVMDTPISFFNTDQYSPAVSYKCLAMRHNIKEASFVHEAKVNNYAFNFNTWMYNAIPNSAQQKSLRQRVDVHVGRSSERRIGMKIKSSMTERGGRFKIGVINSLETKSINEDIQFKALGERIGGGTRAGRRVARGLSATFDPKAWDGDGDGIVQEGTPFERPAIPGINDRATGGVVDVNAAQRAWEDFTKARGAEKARTSLSTNRQKPGRGPRSERVAAFSRAAARAESNAPERIRKPGDKPRISPAAPSERKPSPQNRGVNARISEARAERQVTGFASRSGEKSKRKMRPGVDKASEKDGKIWENLDDEQRSTVEENLKKQYKTVQDWFKTEIADSDYSGRTWWETFLAQTGKKGVSKTDADGKPYSQDSRLSGEALVSLKLAVENILDDIDSEISNLENSIASFTSTYGASHPSLPKMQRDLKRLQNERQRFKQNYEDLITFDEMFESGNWSMIEHLHPTSRSAGLGRTPGGKSVAGLKDPFEGKTKPKIDYKAPSSFFEEYERYREGKRAIVSSERDQKIRKFARRVIENANEKRRKRELRRQRRGTVVGLDGERVGTGKTSVRRRIERAGRRIRRKLSGGSGPESINKEIGKTKSANPTVFNNGNGKAPSVDKSSITRLAALFRGKDDPQNQEALVEQKGRNAGNNLGNAWSASGFNALPVQITEDDAEFLIGQGWIPIQRGHGTPNPPSREGAEGFIDDYINDPKRYITGDGGAAYGPGEYWSRPGPNNTWDSYVSGSYGVGTLAVVSPDARMITITEARKIQAEHNKIWSEVNKALQTIGGGTVGAKDLDPQDLLKEIQNVIKSQLADGDPVWATEAGKVAQAVFQFMSSAGPEDRMDVWDAIQHMINIGGYDTHYAAMLYGYDGVDHEGNSPVVWFNRGALAVIDKPMELPRMKELGKYAKEVA